MNSANFAFTEFSAQMFIASGQGRKRAETSLFSWRASTIAHIYPSVLQALAGLCRVPGRVFSGVPGWGYASCSISTSQNAQYANFAFTEFYEVALTRRSS